MARHALIIPWVGGVEVWHYHPPHTVQAELESRSEGTYVQFTLAKDNQDLAIVHMLTGNDKAYPNRRARDVAVLLTGVHIAFTGNVAFTNLTESDLTDIMEMFGR
jgi:hypothetical protein